MAKHARLSASGSKQWINCPGSIQRENALSGGGGGGSIFAQQGTAAHFVADYCLTTESKAEDHLGVHIWVHEEKDEVAVPAIRQGGALEERLANEGYVCFELVDGDGKGEMHELKCWAINMFVDQVRLEHEKQKDIMAVFGEEDTIGPIVTETWLDMTWLHSLMGGTADANFLGADLWVKLFDLKYGAGVMVEVEDNTQLMIYGLGIMKMHPTSLGVDMWIVQPRLDHPDGPIRHVRLSRKQLEDFAQEVREAAEQTSKPNAPIRAGDWCFWCRAKPFCDEFKAETMERAKMDFDDAPDQIIAPKDIAELEKLARWMPMLDALNKEVEGAIGRLLHQGHKFEDYKLVRKKTNRRFGRPADDPEGRWSKGDEVPEEVVVKIMKSEGMLGDADLYHPKKLKTLPQMEKLGKDAKLALKAITYKPEGPLTVAPRSDPREEEKPDVTGAFPDDMGDMEIPT